MFLDREMEIHISTRQALPVFNLSYNQQLKSNFVCINDVLYGEVLV